MSCTFFVPGADDAPEANFSNANTHSLLGLLGIESDFCGEIPHDQIANVRREITRARNSDRSQAVSETLVSRETNGPLVIECGSTDEQVLYRLGRLDAVLEYAQRVGKPVNWG